jgi:hypothetical protein
MTTDIVLVIPIGPGTPADFVIDTIESYCHHTSRSYEVVLTDDSHQGVGGQVQASLPFCNLLHTPRPMGGWAGLYINLATAYRYALDNFQFKALLKLDTDALVIAPEPEKEALELFDADTMAGMAGQYPLTYNGEPWNIRWPRQRIFNSTRSWKFFARPLANAQLMGYYRKALKNGYDTGESVFGGAYFFSHRCLAALERQQLLPRKSFRSLNLGEDHLFSLLVKSLGFSLNSLSTAGGPVGCSWKGLPAAPEKLVTDGKKIIHSTRQWEHWDEKAIRDYYKSRRGNPENVAVNY